MMMRIYDVTNRFARNKFFGFRDDGVSARIIQGSFDDGRKILELDCDAVMRTAAE